MATVATTITLTSKAVEESSYIVAIGAFYDDAAAAITPATFTWSMTDQDDKAVNARTDVSVTVATAIDIVLSGNDLALPNQSKPWRYVTLEYTYDSDAGTGLPGKQLVAFEIVPLAVVT